MISHHNRLSLIFIDQNHSWLLYHSHIIVCHRLSCVISYVLCLFAVYIPHKNFSFIWRRHHYRWRAAKFRPMLGAQGHWAWRDLHTCCDTGPQFFRSHLEDGLIQSPHTTHKGMWRIYSNPDPHGWLCCVVSKLSHYAMWYKTYIIVCVVSYHTCIIVLCCINLYQCLCCVVWYLYHCLCCIILYHCVMSCPACVNVLYHSMPVLLFVLCSMCWVVLYRYLNHYLCCIIPVS
jgi:hypothetical protein